MSKDKISFRPAPEVKVIADELIPKYHQHLKDFSVRVEYIFVSKTPKSKGMEVWGTCEKVTGKKAYLARENEDADPFFVITISEPVWEILPQESKVALVDHELCHAYAEVKQQKEEAESDEDMETDNPVKLSTQPHDLEEFSCIVRRHGLWRENVEDFVNAALKQKEEKKNAGRPV